MKKTLSFFSLAFAFSVTSFAQNPNPARTLSAAEANQLNGVAQPTVNGKPYNQYIAEQNAAKSSAIATTITDRTALIRPALLQSLLNRPANNITNTATAAPRIPALPAYVKIENGTASVIAAPKEEQVVSNNTDEKKISDAKKND